MNKADLVTAMAEGAELTKNQATDAMNCLLDSIVGTLKKGDKVTLVGFGTFQISARAARTGRNPATGKAIKIPAKNVVRFKAGKEFTETVNKKK